MIGVSFVLLALALQQVFAGVRPLTPEQIERLKTWTEDDKQNIWELSGQVEGDMVLAPGQRNGLINENYRWPNNEIPYELAPSVFTEEEIAFIVESLEQYTQYTCLTVRPRTSEDTDYVYVTGADSGCWSSVGRRGGRQTLNLQRSSPGEGCHRPGTIVHEFLHAAGFYHQQSATERDDYVEIIWENIQSGVPMACGSYCRDRLNGLHFSDDESNKKGYENNFDKYSADVITSFGEPYDYGSVMHYGAYAFSANGEATIVPKDPEAEIGQRYGMSEIDANKVNKMYGCAK